MRHPTDLSERNLPGEGMRDVLMTRVCAETGSDRGSVLYLALARLDQAAGPEAGRSVAHNSSRMPRELKLRRPHIGSCLLPLLYKERHRR